MVLSGRTGGGPPVRAIPATMVGGKKKIPHIFHVSEFIFQGSCRKKNLAYVGGQK